MTTSHALMLLAAACFIIASAQFFRAAVTKRTTLAGTLFSLAFLVAGLVCLAVSQLT